MRPPHEIHSHVVRIEANAQLDEELPEALMNDGPPPAYSESLGRVSLDKNGFNTEANVSSECGLWYREPR